ncbi:MAG: radical SAM protein, partial [Syntrophobacteraceae bacterium]|nr:radical SAM protein [Syntrophobacteraceae bacterium]
PAHLAHGVTPLDRKTTEEEYAHACSLLDRFGLENGFVQSSCED